MSTPKPTSRCTQGYRLYFRWFDGTPAIEGLDFETATVNFCKAISKPSRIFNDYIWAMAIAEFENLLELAILGQIRSAKQVASVDASRSPPLFELRWQGISVLEASENGELSSANVLVRMYHSEPEAFEGFFIGHRIHEKDISVDSEIRARQNFEIQLARSSYEIGRSISWGITR